MDQRRRIGRALFERLARLGLGRLIENELRLLSWPAKKNVGPPAVIRVEHKAAVPGSRGEQTTRKLDARELQQPIIPDRDRRGAIENDKEIEVAIAVQVSNRNAERHPGQIRQRCETCLLLFQRQTELWL